MREQVLAIARAGAKAGCKEALFTLGDKPELRYGAAREALARLGHETTLSYLAEMAALVLKETGLLPHLNPGVMSREETERLRAVSVSQGIMLESAAERLSARGGPHFGSPDKAPARAPGGDRGGRRGGGAVHLGHPDRHRRDPRASASRRCSRCATCTSATAISRKSSSRISAPSPAPAWRPRPSPTSPTICGRSRWRG